MLTASGAEAGNAWFLFEELLMIILVKTLSEPYRETQAKFTWRIGAHAYWK